MKHPVFAGAGFPINDAILMPRLAVSNHQETVDDLASAALYHSTKMEIVSEIGDALLSRAGTKVICRAQKSDD